MKLLQYDPCKTSSNIGVLFITPKRTLIYDMTLPMFRFDATAGFLLFISNRVTIATVNRKGNTNEYR